MQKSLFALASFAIASGVQAFRSKNFDSSPFVGEYADHKIIEQDDRSTHRAEPMKLQIEKYAALKSNMTFQTRKSTETRLYEKLFGESEETMHLKNGLEYYQKLSKNAKYGKGRLGIDAQLLVTEIQDDVFAADYIMGETTFMKGIIDTATDFVGVESKDCPNCEGAGYESTLNTQIEEYSSWISYGQYEFYGQWAKDKFCIGLGNCVSDVEFFYIQENGSNSTRLPSIASSVVGHARPNQELLVAPGTVSESKSNLLASLKPENQTFSTRFRRDFISWVDYGAPDVTQRNGVPATIKANKDMFWSTVSGGVRFGEFQAGSYSWSFDPEQTVTGRAEEVYTIFDTALTSIYISELWFESFIEAYFGNQEIEFAVVDGFVTYTCQSASLDHIYYMVDGHYLRLDQSDLTGEIQTTNGTYCYLKVEPINAPFNILGSQAYIDYYIEHNFNASTITITPAPDSQKRSLERVGKLPENEFAIKMYSENVEGGDIIALGIAIFCAVAAYGYLIYALWYEYNTLESITTGGFIGWSLGGIVGAAIVFFVVNWIGLLLFMPGNVIEPMNPADESVITVTVLGPRMTILAIISALLVKLNPKKPKAEQKKEETATVAHAIEEYMTNDME